MTSPNTRNLHFHPGKVNLDEREKRNRHRAACIWFTGLSGSGKSTLATGLEKVLFDLGIQTYVLDGDNVRHGLNKDLGFSNEDRGENIRRIGEVSRLFVDAGHIVMTAFISPFRKDRDLARRLMGGDRFVEVYVDCDLETCKRRDPKGLYEKAIRGEVKEFTGVSSPYEPPDDPEILLNNRDGVDVKTNVGRILDYIKDRGIIKAD